MLGDDLWDEFDSTPAGPPERVPQWRRDEMAGGPAEPQPWRSPSPSGYDEWRPVPARRRAPVGSVVALALVVALTFGFGWYRSHAGAVPHAPWGDSTPHVARVDGGPPPGMEEAAVPLGRAPALAWDGSSYAFTKTRTLSDGTTTPVAWSPCRPIHYAINPTGAPADFGAVVASVLGEVSAATGLTFVADNATDEAPSEDREPYQPDRYGDLWAPLIIGFADSRQLHELDGDVAGVGGAVSVTRSDLDYTVYVSGSVWLDTSLVGEPDDAYVTVLRHELGHAMGLAHVDDPTQLMNPRTTPDVTTYQAGDLYGLSQEGHGVCAPDL